MVDTPPATLVTVAVHEALIKQLVDGQREVLEELRRIVSAMSHGDARFRSLEEKQSECRALHDSQANVAMHALPGQVQVMAEQVATLRLVVYGACGVSLVGLLGTLGAVIVKVLGQKP